MKEFLAYLAGTVTGTVFGTAFGVMLIGWCASKHNGMVIERNGKISLGDDCKK